MNLNSSHAYLIVNLIILYFIKCTKAQILQKKKRLNCVCFRTQVINLIINKCV